jgi:hypothetical protein
VPPVLLACVEDLGTAARRLADDLAEGAPLDGVVDDLVGVAADSAEVPRTALSADVVLAQVRSTTVDLLQVAGLEGRDALGRVRGVTGG